MMMMMMMIMMIYVGLRFCFFVSVNNRVVRLVACCPFKVNVFES